jgi:hypothetical protein
MREYKLIQFKPSDFKDQHGNTWCDVAFEGVSEPVKWVVKDPSKAEVGKSYYGEIEQKTSKAGKPYQRFYSKTKPEQDSKDEYWEDKNKNIKAQWAIGQAVKATEIKADQDGYERDVENLAHTFFSMVDRIAHKDIPQEMDDKIGNPVQDHANEYNDEPINLDEIPF